MNYHNITHDDMLNGNGLRVVLWVSGCSHQCVGCHNSQTWDEKSGILFDQNAKEEIFQELSKDYVKGITFTGGDPLFYKNIDTIFNLIKEIKEKFPTKDIWLYTGFTYEQILENNKLSLLLREIDVLVDGKFELDKKSNVLPFKGSSNQRIIDLKKSIKLNQLIEYM